MDHDPAAGWITVRPPLKIESIYSAIVTSPQWAKTLLLITYDEHGGFYDHVFPGRSNDIAPLMLDPADDNRPVNYRGYRVPTFVISAWVPARTVSSATYDHTSILKTIIARFLGDHPPPMGLRVRQAIDVGSLLTLRMPRAPILPPARSTAIRTAAPRPPPVANHPQDDFRRVMTAMRDRLKR